MIYRVELGYSTFDGYIKTDDRHEVCGRATRIGPYNWNRSDDPKVWMFMSEAGWEHFKHATGYVDARHPTVREDHRLVNALEAAGINSEWGWEANMMFGFESLEALKLWFDADDREQLGNTGFVVSVYEGGQEIHGSKQSLFSKDATLKEILYFGDI